MKNLLRKLLKQVLEQFINKTFTLDNVMKFRDVALSKLKEQVEQTETTIDDWGYELVAKLLDDRNLEKIYGWVLAYTRTIVTNNCLAPEDSLGALARKLDFQAEDNSCGMPDLATVVVYLEIVVQILIEWFKK